MNNKIFLFYKPSLSISRLLFRNAIINQVAQNQPQKVFSERILVDMKSIESIWHRSKFNSKSFNIYVHRCCKENSELSTYVTDMIKCATSRVTGSPTFVLELVKSFSDYFKDNNVQFSSTLNEKIDVLSAIVELKNYQVLQLACTAFKLYDQPLTYKPLIESLILKRKYTEAALLTSALQLQKELNVKEILFPLLLEGKMYSVVLYITDHPDLQLKCVKYLDGYLSKKNVTPSEKSRKVIRRLSSIINVFKISLDNAPNLQFIRSKGAINLLIRRFIQQSVSETSWIEMIKNVVKDDEDLKKYLVIKLLFRKEKKIALKMAEILNINAEDVFSEAGFEILPDEDSQTENLENCENEENFEIFDITDEFLELSLKPKDVKVIDTKENFMACIDDIRENYKIIGIDSEWKPHFGLSRDKLSLIQLAVHDKVYIIDVFVLSEKLESQCWDKFLDDIFGNDKIVKLGCGIVSDVHMILESIKSTKGKAVKFSHILDMVLFYQKLHEVYPLEMSYRGDKMAARGLSSMCEVILGKPLNKEDRLCDWEYRPLMERQLQYAALDAYCLLQMYDKLKEESVEKNMNFDHLAMVAIVLTTSQWKPKKKYKGKKTGNAFQVHTSTPVEQLKVCVDAVFEDQGKELRKLGADVVILKRDNSEEKAVELSEKEGRIVICSPALYNVIKHKVKEGFGYYFSILEEKESQISNFLKHVNAQVSTKGICSRCVNCNSNDGIKISAEDIEKLQDLSSDNSLINCKLKDSIDLFSDELKIVLTDILNSNFDLKFPSSDKSLSSEFAFLCKTCGHVS